ncbi:hypothetical protein PG989_007372 [Apiospora arundinis]
MSTGPYSLRNTIVVLLHLLYKLLRVVLSFLTANYFFQPESLEPAMSEKPAAPMKNIVIVGGSYAAVNTAHRILKHAKKSGVTQEQFKVTLVSRDSHFYWNIASPRALIPGQFTDEQVSQPIAEGFRQYSSQFEFVLASLSRVDVEAKRIEVVDIDASKECRRTLQYDYLILATGSSTKASEVPFKSRGSTEATMAALHDFQNRIGSSRTIVIVGGGATGVETAGEIKFEYGDKKEVILINSPSELLTGRPDKVTRTALQMLQDLHVDVRLNTRVLGTETLEDGRTQLTLSGSGGNNTATKDDKLVADLYIPTHGEKPNSSYMPAAFLGKTGHIRVGMYLDVEGADGVYALGDVTDLEPAQFLFLEFQSKHIAKNMLLVLGGKPQRPYKPSTFTIMGLQIGRNQATGHYNNFKFPSWLFAYVRKTLYTEWLPGTVDGSRM